MSALALIKIGGGLITDKEKPLAVRETMMRAAARSLANAIRANPSVSFLIGNGAGSFGHFIASLNRAPDAVGFDADHVAEIHASVVKLNAIFVDHLIEEGVPAVSVSPAEHISCNDAVVTHQSTDSLLALLSAKKVPVIFGDILRDEVRGGTIFSTESLFEIIIPSLTSFDDISVIYAGNTEGILDGAGTVIPEIRARDAQAYASNMTSPLGFDVTGGMRHKLESAARMTRLAKRVYIVSGSDPSAITKATAGEAVGTRILS